MINTVWSRTFTGTARQNLLWLSLACGLAASATAEVLQATSLLFDPPVIDFADRYEHETSVTNVLIVNGGNEPVVIERLGRSCPDCLILAMDNLKLNPAEMGTLRVELCPETGPGFLQEIITVETASGYAPVLPVQARIHASYDLDGAPVLLQARQEDDAIVHAVSFTPRFEMKGQPVPPDDPDSLFAVKISPDLHPGRFVASMTVKRLIPVGMTSESIRIGSTDATDPPCWLDVSVFLPPPVHVYPARLRVAPLAREQLRILFIEQRLETPAQLLDVRVPEPGITWEYFPGYALERSRINVYLHAMDSKMGNVGDIVLVTNHEAYPEIRIPVVVDEDMVAGPVFEDLPVPVAGRRGCGCDAKP